MESKFCNEAQGFALYVKTHGMKFCDGGTEEMRRTAWQRVSKKWWEKADRAAKKAGFDGVVQCGRSGGWAATTPPWDGTGPLTAAHFNRFKASIAGLMGAVEKAFAEELAVVIEEYQGASAKLEADLDKIREIFERAEIAPDDQRFLAIFMACGLETMHPKGTRAKIYDALRPS